MPLVFLIVGVAFIVAAIRGQQAQLFALLKADFTGSNSFGVWLLALFLVGAIGYADELKPVSNALLTLVILGMLLSNRGFIAKFQQATGV